MSGRWRDALRGAAAAAALVGLGVVLPVALARAVGWPLPRTIPSWGAASRALTSGDVADSTWLKAVACVAWLAWAQFAAAAVREAMEQARGRVARPLPGVAWPLQAMAGRLVATAALLASALSPRIPVTPLPLSAVIPAVEVTAGAPALHVVPTAPVAPAPAARADTSPGRTWTVARRDTLWSIAERALGDGERYREIFEMNRGVVQGDGRTLTRPDVIRPGWVLALPSDAAAAPPASQPRGVRGPPRRQPVARGRADHGRRPPRPGALRAQQGADAAGRQVPHRPGPHPAGVAARGACRADGPRRCRGRSS